MPVSAISSASYSDRIYHCIGIIFHSLHELILGSLGSGWTWFRGGLVDVMAWWEWRWWSRGMMTVFGSSRWVGDAGYKVQQWWPFGGLQWPYHREYKRGSITTYPPCNSCTYSLPKLHTNRQRLVLRMDFRVVELVTVGKILLAWAAGCLNGGIKKGKPTIKLEPRRLF